MVKLLSSLEPTVASARKRLWSSVAEVPRFGSHIFLLVSHVPAHPPPLPYIVQVIMCCRNEASGQQAREDILKHNPNASLQVMQLDLASLNSVNFFADKLLGQEKKVDILVNNAGVMMCPPRKSADNYELQFATNHLGHFLLTQRLLPLLANSSDGRILNVSSVHHVRGRIFFDDIHFERAGSYDPVEAYCQSKLANVLFNRELAKQLRSQVKYGDLKCYALNPGTINTNLTRHVTGGRKVIFNLIGAIFNLDIQTGTQTTLYCALEPTLTNESGLYYRYYSSPCTTTWSLT